MLKTNQDKMSYIALALKYRPQNFDQVVGQKHVVSALGNAILQDRVHHAYLFSGPRGVGKTSLARILAKALNCVDGPTAKPCGKCPSCLDIAKGSSLDIIEVDGASNRGIDEIRTIRENVRLTSAGGRFKIYIIDEVHMLTQEAFNALLKTLEEPPAHVKFIFATTHPHKVLPTILSRCQKFQFNLFSLEEIVSKLKSIIKSEKIKIEDSLLFTIARAASGSIRDAESLLDQLIPVLLEEGSLDDIFSFLGIIDEDSLDKITQLVVEKNIGASLDFVEKIAKEGKDIGAFLNAFIEHLRNLLLAKVTPKGFNELSEVSPQSKEHILKLSKVINTADILRLIDLLLEAKDFSIKLNTVRIPLDLALVKFCNSIIIERSPQKPAAPVQQPKPDPRKTKKTGSSYYEVQGIDDFESVVDDYHLPKSAKEQKTEEGEPDLSATADINFQEVKRKWNSIISMIGRKRAAIASHLSFSSPVSVKGSVINIGFNKGDFFHKGIVEDSKNSRFIGEVASGLLGKKVGVRFIIDDISREDLPHNLNLAAKNGPIPAEPFHLTDDDQSRKKKKPVTIDPQAQDDEFLNDLLDTFDGKFQSDDK